MRKAFTHNFILSGIRCFLRRDTNSQIIVSASAIFEQRSVNVQRETDLSTYRSVSVHVRPTSVRTQKKKNKKKMEYYSICSLCYIQQINPVFYTHRPSFLAFSVWIYGWKISTLSRRGHYDCRTLRYYQRGASNGGYIARGLCDALNYRQDNHNLLGKRG